MRARVETRLGALEGGTDASVLCFRGVPYAAPPLGPLRFAAPEPASAWSGVLDARRYPAAPPQPRHTPMPQSEDCLKLCIWTPALDGAPRPVLVWLHGSEFLYGSLADPLYNPARLARRGDAVVVSVQSRVGALGFLDLPPGKGDDGPRGDGHANRGILDQRAALHFVRDEIDAFGGDPSRVTVFGSAAGATSTLALIASGAAPALFSRAIAQNASVGIHSRVMAERIRATFLEKIGFGPAELVKLAGVPIEALLRAQSETHDFWLRQGVRPFRPTYDGGLLREAPARALERIELPLLIGLGGGDPTEPELHDVLRGSSVFAYRFDTTLPAPPSEDALVEPDVPFVMGTLEQSTGGVRPDADARRLARRMQDAWLAFARSGNPSHRGIGDWPLHQPDHPTTLCFGAEITLG